jgi:hypothetical protein
MEFILPTSTSATPSIQKQVIPRARLRSNSGLEAFSSILAFDAEKHNPNKTSSSAVLRRRRRANTTNSLFSLRSTMETTPIQTTLACIAHVVFRHLTKTANWLRERPTEQRVPEKWLVFNDSSKTVTKKRDGGVSVFLGRESRDSFSSDERGQSFDFDFEEVPQEQEILFFFKTVYDTAQLEKDTLVTSLVYIERLLGVGGRRGMLITAHNWRTVVFTSLVLASKMCDDFTMWTGDFSRILGCSPQRLNELEMKFLEALRYDVNLKSSDYARYHFTLRSLAYHLSLDGDEIKGSSTPLKFKAATNMSGLSKLIQERTKLNAAAAVAASRKMSQKEIGGGVTKSGGGGSESVADLKNLRFGGQQQNSGGSFNFSKIARNAMRIRINPAHQRQRSESEFVAKDVTDEAPELLLHPHEILSGKGIKAANLRRGRDSTYLSTDELLLVSAK